MKRIAVIQDLSCFGKCSTTVALPVLSVCGVEACPLPTALLSSHTAYPSPVKLNTTAFMADAIRHWQSIGAEFDGILVGYLGSAEQLAVVAGFIDHFSSQDTVVVLDPAMADHGRLYSGFAADYPGKLLPLCARADFVLPNATEAAMLLGRPYREDASSAALLSQMAELVDAGIILTGVRDGDRIGAAWHGAQSEGIATVPRVAGSYHGTGDLFAALVTAALVQGHLVGDAVRMAVDFTARAAAETQSSGRHPREGLVFEPTLRQLSAYFSA